MSECTSWVGNFLTGFALVLVIASLVGVLAGVCLDDDATPRQRVRFGALVAVGAVGLGVVVTWLAVYGAHLSSCARAG